MTHWSQWMQLPQEKQRCASASAFATSSPSCTSSWSAMRSAAGRRGDCGAPPALVVVQADGRQRHHRLAAGRSVHRRANAARSRNARAVDGACAARSPMPTASVTKRARCQVAASPDACIAGLALRVHPQQRPAARGAAPMSSRRGSWPMELSTASTSSVNSLPCSGRSSNGRARRPGGIRRAGSAGQRRAFLTERSIAPSTSVMPSSSASTTSSRCAGICFSRSERQQRHRVAGAARAARHVDGRAAAAHHQRARQRRRLAWRWRRGSAPSMNQGRVASICGRPWAAARRARRTPHRAWRMRFPAPRRRWLHGRSEPRHPGHDARDLGVEHAPRQPVGDAIAHHAAEFFAGFIQAHAVAHAAQLVGDRQPAGPPPTTATSPAAGCAAGAGTAQPCSSAWSPT